MLPIFLANISDIEEKNKFEQIYYKYRKLIKFIAMDILHDEFLAEDAVQEILIKILNNSQKVNDISCPQTKSFIVIISRSVSLDIYRKRQKISVVSEEIPDTMPDSKLTDEQIIQKNEHENLYAAIASMPTIYRDALVMSYVHSLSTKEIADLCGISIEAAKKRVQRARQVLKNELERREFDESERLIKVRYN